MLEGLVYCSGGLVQAGEELTDPQELLALLVMLVLRKFGGFIRETRASCTRSCVISL